MSSENFRSPSFWFSTLDEPIEPRAPLDGDAQFDVAIVGAGYTGLWTAYYLNQREPSCRIAVVEAEVAGFGASGRNGGWCAYHLSGIEVAVGRPEQARARVGATARDVRRRRRGWPSIGSRGRSIAITRRRGARRGEITARTRAPARGIR